MIAGAIYALSLIVLVLVVMHVYDAWRRVDWAQWWAEIETRTSEGPRGSGKGRLPGTRGPSGARRPYPGTPPPRSAGARKPQGSRR